MKAEKPSPASTKAAIGRAAQRSKAPWRGAGGKLPLLIPGQTLARMRQISGEDRDEAVRRATLMPWWRAVISEIPAHVGDWWVWVVNIAKLPPCRPM